MAEDEIEKLLREVGGQGAGGVPQRRSEPQPPARGGTFGGRLAFAVAAAAVLGAGTWLLGLLMPLVSAVSAGIGGAVAAGIVALLLGPPRWFSS